VNRLVVKQSIRFTHKALTALEQVL